MHFPFATLPRLRQPAHCAQQVEGPARCSIEGEIAGVEPYHQLGASADRLQHSGAVAEAAVRQQAVSRLDGQPRQGLSSALGARRRNLKVIALQIGKPALARVAVSRKEYPLPTCMSRVRSKSATLSNPRIRLTAPEAKASPCQPLGRRLVSTCQFSF